MTETDGDGGDGRAMSRRGLLRAVGGGVVGLVGGTRATTVGAAQARGPTVYVGTDSGRLVAFDAGGGDRVWVSALSEGFYSAPTVVDGTLFCTSVDGTTYAVDATTGEVLWEDHGTGFFSSAAPTVVDGTVYASREADLVALDAATGAQAWRFGVDTNGVASPPSVVGGTAYTTIDDTLYALDADTGAVRWRTTAKGGRGPTRYGDVVYVGTDDGVAALRATDGEEVWRTGGTVDSSVTVADGQVYVATEGGVLHALDAASGRGVWRRDIGDVTDVHSPTVAGGRVYAVADGDVVALDATSGDRVWETQGGGLATTPTVWEGLVYVGGLTGGDGDPTSEIDPQGRDANGTVSAIDAEDGTPFWRYQSLSGLREGLGEADPTSPTVVADPGGDSAGSRVRQATLGHHDSWADGARGVDLDVEQSAPTRTSTAEPTVGAEDPPGAWELGAVSVIGVAVVYAFSRRLRGDSDRDNDDGDETAAGERTRSRR